MCVCQGKKTETYMTTTGSPAVFSAASTCTRSRATSAARAAEVARLRVQVDAAEKTAGEPVVVM